jgi:hypothetical protein
MRKLLLLILGSVALLVIGGATTILLMLHFSPLCGEEVVMEKPSPDGHYVAVLMSRNCGATTPYVAHINLRLASSPFQSDSHGVINEGAIWWGSKYGGDRFCWSGPRRLEIGYPWEENNLNREPWRDVTIGSDYRNPECH